MLHTYAVLELLGFAIAHRKPESLEDKDQNLGLKPNIILAVVMAFLMAIIALVVFNELRLEEIFKESLNADYEFLWRQLEIDGAKPGKVVVLVVAALAGELVQEDPAVKVGYLGVLF